MEKNAPDAKPPSSTTRDAPALTVYVGKIPPSANDVAFRRALERACGCALVDWRRAREPNGGGDGRERWKRFGFATFADVRGVLTCVRVVDGLECETKDGERGRLTCNMNAATKAATERALAEGGTEIVGRDNAREDARRARAFARVMRGEDAEDEEGEISSDGGGVGDADGDNRAVGVVSSEVSSEVGGETTTTTTTTTTAVPVGGVVMHGLPPPPPEPLAPKRLEVERSATPESVADGPTTSGRGDVPRPPPPSMFKRQEYEANERTDRLFREREKAVDDLVRANAKERERRERTLKEKRADRRRELKRDLEESEDSDDETTLPLWERSERARERRKKFRNAEKETDEKEARRDAAEEEQEAKRERERERERAAKIREDTSRGAVVEVPPPPPVSSSEPARVRGFDVEARRVPTSFGISRTTGTHTTTTTTKSKAKSTTTGGLLSAAFAADEDDEDATPLQPPPSTTKLDVAAIVATIPTSKRDVFAHTIDWSLVFDAGIDAIARKWIAKKITSLLGEPEPALARFISDKLSPEQTVSPSRLVDDLEPALDVEAEPFVVGLWRLIIFELAKRRATTA